MDETRPVLYITYALTGDGVDAPVLDVSESLDEARRNVMSGGRSGFCHRVTRLTDGVYGHEEFVEVINQASEETRSTEEQE